MGVGEKRKIGKGRTIRGKTLLLNYHLLKCAETKRLREGD